MKRMTAFRGEKVVWMSREEGAKCRREQEGRRSLHGALMYSLKCHFGQQRTAKRSSNVPLHHFGRQK